MNVLELLGTISERLASTANVRNVYGDPVTVGGRTVIPVASVRYGFGAGGGKGSAEARSGGGGGGGVRATPSGALEITAERTRFVPFVSPTAAVLAFAAGILVGAGVTALAVPKRVEIVKR